MKYKFCAKIVSLLFIVTITTACNSENKIHVTENQSPNVTSILSVIESETVSPIAKSFDITDISTAESTQSTAVTEFIPTPTVENDITLTAQSYIGIPFTEDGESPETGFDNSGFIYYVLLENGYVNCPRNTGEQLKMGDEINSLNDLKSGDLVFFNAEDGGTGFGGIYIGDGYMVYCPFPGEFVKMKNINAPYWINNFNIGVSVI